MTESMYTYLLIATKSNTIILVSEPPSEVVLLNRSVLKISISAKCWVKYLHDFNVSIYINRPSEIGMYAINNKENFYRSR